MRHNTRRYHSIVLPATLRKPIGMTRLITRSFQFATCVLFSCGIPLKQKPALLSGEPLPFSANDSLAINNELIWARVSAQPDSAMIALPELNGKQATLIISGKLDSLYYAPGKITICSVGKADQVLTIKASGGLWTGGGRYYPLLKFEDMNFDGFRDLQVFDNAGGTGNVWYVTFLYDPETKKFIYHTGLSELSHTKLDAGHQEIASYNTLGWCYETVNFYGIRNNKLEIRRTLYTESGKGGNCKVHLEWGHGEQHKDSILGELGMRLYDSLFYDAVKDSADEQ
jgi:hypothetical protein